MTVTDKFNLAGVIISALGSALGMVGVILQTNGYYAFKSFQLFEHLWRVFRALFTKGPNAAWNQTQATVSLAQQRGEDRAKSMIGLYCVIFAFFLQSLGAALLIWALFAGK